MHTEINSFRVFEGMHKEYKGGKPVLKREHGCTASPFDKKKTLVPKGNSDKIFFELYIHETYIYIYTHIYKHICRNLMDI